MTDVSEAERASALCYAMLEYSGASKYTLKISRRTLLNDIGVKLMRLGGMPMGWR